MIGVNFARIANPAKDFPAWVGVFALVGVITANAFVLIIHQITKTTEPDKTAEKTETASNS